MKKITLLICALATTVASFATPQGTPKKLFMRSDVPSVTYLEAQFDKTAAKKQTAADLDTVYIPYRALGTYQVGVPSDGMRYGFYQQGLISPFTDTILFLNNDTLPSTWYVGGQQVAQNVYYKMPVEFGDNELPTMKTNDVEGYYFPEYQVSALATADWKTVSPNFYNAVNVGSATYVTFTKCAMYTEDPRQDEYGSDWKLVGAGDLGSYSYGSKLTNPFESTDGNTVYFDTIFVPFPQEGAMYIDHITLGVYNSGQSSADFFPGEDDHIRLSIYQFDEEGNIDWQNPIARSTANLDNFTEYASSYTYIGLLQFNFMSQDPVTGAETAAPITVNGSFIVALDEFNKGTTNIGFISDFYSQLPGQTYYFGRDSETGEEYFTTLWKSPSNIMLNIVGLMPAFVAPQEVTFEANETEKTLEIPSNVWDEDIIIDADDWISAEIVTDYDEEVYEGQTYYTHKFKNFVTIKVEPTSNAREGAISIDALGLPVVITVKQEAGAGVENTVAFKNDNKTYNVLGQEVGNDYKGVVIRNGEKFVR